mmetsp:Transcript_44204/g.106507  ORF Transcript_44204/g.106507 Transcript_44204/m.106507 type:complete len:392 (+) Transcript_44204:153-1328(+)|eukprot:CAMPEP_0113622572 /NCGR_PEP_ID=MMETSP0017_2-20120614/11571_1 /TAXON_ID=2856 /ORGANISM="Cylindrotheca closterium" /LENGTH=391 /DNA_ID=CAMNT_0000532415 /DNA_START=58 /DNA_END=1233 /DNA_ORIENTATION=- /assembly_acc=CAM_ASM_000147
MNSELVPFRANSRLAGEIGLGLSAALWLVASWRLVFHLFVRKQDDSETDVDEESPRDDPSPSTSCQCTPSAWFTRRRSFHTLLWMSQTIEIFAYINISGLHPLAKTPSIAEELGYILLDVTGRSVLELLSFATITGLWLKTALRSGPTRGLGQGHDFRIRLFPALFLVIVLLLVISSASLSTVVFLDDRSGSLEKIQNSDLSRIQLLLEASAWGLHSLVVLECLLLTWKRIETVVEPSRERRILLCKAVLPMLTTALLYLIRCLWLVCIYFHVPNTERGSWCWWIAFQWCPTLLSVSMLLYSARKRDQTTTGQLQEPLLRPARPPAEAFLAFSRHLNGEDVDDSFILNSPAARALISEVESISDVGEVEDLESQSSSSSEENESAPQPNDS